MKRVFFFGLLLASLNSYAQELYPFTEPASNMPSGSISVKTTATFLSNDRRDGHMQRYMPEMMVGINKALMVHVATSFSDMHQSATVWDGARLYAKYRFLSNDDVHKHFRMAAFGTAAYSRNRLEYNEINLSGDQSGVEGGLIATQLLNKFALSATAGWNEIINKARNDKTLSKLYAFQSVAYSLSAGYLLLPIEYKDYDQMNLNLYVELLGNRNIHFAPEKYYVDLAPSVQAIFNSTAKLNFSYRFQLAGDIDRPGNRGFMISVEYIFLNALKRHSSAQR